MKNELSARLLPLRFLFGLSRAHVGLIGEVVCSLLGRLKAGLNLINPSKVLGVLTRFFHITHRIRHIILLGGIGVLIYLSTSYIDYGYFHTMISLKLSGVDISNCDNLPFETMIKISACTE
jgi:hypothetical protein